MTTVTLSRPVIIGGTVYFDPVFKTPCQDCNWSHPDTCRMCRQGKRSVVMAVNHKGVK